MSANGKPKGVDISIVKLVPRNERKVAKKYRQRIEASLRAVGLIEPLIVFPLDDGYEILDGALRYRILLDHGVETVPCLIHSVRDGFTGNRMVNQLSASQEMRMLRKSLEELDEKTIANALGMQGISHRLNKGLLAKLHDEVVKVVLRKLKFFAKCSRVEKEVGELQIYHEERMENHFSPREGFAMNTSTGAKTGEVADAVMVNVARKRATAFDVGMTQPTDLSGDWEKAVADVEARKHAIYGRWNVERHDVVIIALTTFSAWGTNFSKNWPGCLLGCQG